MCIRRSRRKIWLGIVNVCDPPIHSFLNHNILQEQQANRTENRNHLIIARIYFKVLRVLGFNFKQVQDTRIIKGIIPCVFTPVLHRPASVNEMFYLWKEKQNIETFKEEIQHMTDDNFERWTPHPNLASSLHMIFRKQYDPLKHYKALIEWH